MSNHSISFSTGLKTVEINGDPERMLRFNPRDFNIPAKMDELIQESRRIAEGLTGLTDERDAGRRVAEADSLLCVKMDALFGRNASEKLFEGVNCLTLVTETDENGAESTGPLLQIALEKLMPIVSAGMEKVLSSEEVQRRKLNAQFLGT